MDPNDLLDLQRIRISRAQAGLALRQQRIVRNVLEDLQKRLGRVHAGTWTEAELNATRVLLGQAMRQMVGDQMDDLGAGLREVTKMSAKDAARYLASMDKAHLGAVRPLRFDSLEWWERTDKRIGQARLRQFSRSFQAYGASSVAAIEDAIGQRILVGESWDKARQQVWESTRDVVGDRRWMVDRIVRTETAAAYNGTTLAALYEEDTDDEPMLKKLVATFDSVTGMDSHFVHGQTRKLTEQFMDDHGRSYDAPPNRPHDREIVVGWRKSWGAEGGGAMADFDRATATPRDYAEIPPPKIKPAVPPPPTPEEIPFAPAAADLYALQLQLGQIRAHKAVIGLEMRGVIQSRIVLPRGIKHPPESVASIEAHNLGVDGRVTALRIEVRKLQQEQAQIEIAIRRRKEAERKAKAAGAEVPEPKPERLPKPKAVSKVEGPGKVPTPKPGPPPVTVNEMEPGQWFDLDGVRVQFRSVVNDVTGAVRIRSPGGKTDQLVTLGAERKFKPLPADVKMSPDEVAKWLDSIAKLHDSLTKKSWRYKLLLLARETLENAAASLPVYEAAKLAKRKRGNRIKGAENLTDLDRTARGVVRNEAAEMQAALRWAPGDFSEWHTGRYPVQGQDATAWATPPRLRRLRGGGHSIGFDPRFFNKKRADKNGRAYARQVEAGRNPSLADGHIIARRDAKDAAKLHLAAVTRHEFGHVIDHALQQSSAGKAILMLWHSRVLQVTKAQWEAVSLYGATKPKVEGLAEAFMLASFGEWDVIPKPLHAPLRLMLWLR
jgi:hypothetical protein